MKCWYAFLMMGIISCALPSEPALGEVAIEKSKKQYSFEQFKADFERYYVEPGWVVAAFVSLSLDDFDKAWELFITTLRMDSWKFFVTAKKDYSERKYREPFIVQCKHYHDALSNLVVDVHNKRLFLVTGIEKTRYLKEPGIITVMQYWKAKRNTLYHHFYAFYCDRVIAQLYESVTNTSWQLGTTEYSALVKKAKAYRNQLTFLFKFLQGGEYDGDYAYHLKRYREVLELLRKEHKAQGGVDGEYDDYY